MSEHWHIILWTKKSCLLLFEFSFFQSFHSHSTSIIINKHVKLPLSKLLDLRNIHGVQSCLYFFILFKILTDRKIQVQYIHIYIVQYWQIIKINWNLSKTLYLLSAHTIRQWMNSRRFEFIVHCFRFVVTVSGETEVLSVRRNDSTSLIPTLLIRITHKI